MTHTRLYYVGHTGSGFLAHSTYLGRWSEAIKVDRDKSLAVMSGTYLR
jgi:hypothetical protein